MAEVIITGFCPETEKPVSITIDTSDASETYNLQIENGWYTEKDLNAIIRELQKAKRIYKTGIIKEGD